ncbi:bZIP transcription factor 27-like [Primulina huaijiensis]|uniref:bZIP transcription factor 27-like n=1 Tax=Primulina huaijiensis TaxID=1492673 RepID=UPI003CC73B8B
MWTSTPSIQNPFSSPNSTFAAILDNEDPSSCSLRLQKNMEDVWKDIGLSSLQYHHPSSRGMVLLDFFSSDTRPAVSPPPQLPIPAMLTLSSGHDQTRNPLADQPIISHAALPNSQFDDLVPADYHSAAGVGKKRFPESERNSSDRRHKRMIKNRESAARSRARKQAYTNELELEVAHLMEENARLKKQQQQVKSCLYIYFLMPFLQYIYYMSNSVSEMLISQWFEAAEYHRHSKKKSLYRASTAPF